MPSEQIFYRRQKYFAACGCFVLVGTLLASVGGCTCLESTDVMTHVTANLVCSKLVRLQELERCAVAIGLSMLVQVLMFLVVRFRILLNSSEIDLPLWK